MSIQLYTPTLHAAQGDDLLKILGDKYAPKTTKSLITPDIAQQARLDPLTCQETMLLIGATLIQTHNLRVLVNNVFRIWHDRLYYSQTWRDIFRDSARDYRQIAGLTDDDLANTALLQAKVIDVVRDYVAHFYFRGNFGRLRHFEQYTFNIYERVRALVSEMHLAHYAETPVSFTDVEKLRDWCHKCPYILTSESLVRTPRYLNDAIIPAAANAA